MPLSPEYLIEQIWEMNVEAVPRENGQLTGLRWYHGHLDPHASPTGRDNTETAWAVGLGRRLSATYPVVNANQPRYPDSPLKADLFIQDESNNKWWIEIKGAWKWYTQAGQPKRNVSYRKWLVQAEQDCTKLSQLRYPHATHAALIVIGFTRLEDSMAQELIGLHHGICANPSFHWAISPSGGPLEKVYSWDPKFLVSATVWSRSLLSHAT